MNKKQKMNKNDIILSKKDIINQMNFNDFEYKDKFSFLCDLIPEKAKERLVIKNPSSSLIHRRGILYLFILENKLIKVGSSTVSFPERVTSYNCGRKAFRKNGTCSTTNYLVLQSLLNINKPVKVYSFHPDEIEIDVWGEKEAISLPTKRFEKKILTELKNKGKLPIFCTQK